MYLLRPLSIFSLERLTQPARKQWQAACSTGVPAGERPARVGGATSGLPLHSAGPFFGLAAVVAALVIFCMTEPQNAADTHGDGDERQCAQ
jgi:hypothetical protein